MHHQPSTKCFRCGEMLNSNFLKENIQAYTFDTEYSFLARGGVKSNQTNFELIFIEFFELFLPFQIN